MERKEKRNISKNWKKREKKQKQKWRKETRSKIHPTVTTKHNIWIIYVLHFIQLNFTQVDGTKLRLKIKLFFMTRYYLWQSLNSYCFYFKFNFNVRINDWILTVLTFVFKNLICLSSISKSFNLSDFENRLKSFSMYNNNSLTSRVIVNQFFILRICFVF
jgi:hypothetical protein